MRWTKEQLQNHPNRDRLLGQTPQVKCAQPAQALASRPGELPPCAWPFEVPPGSIERRFVVPGKVCPKPRMTKRDKWAKRPAVLRYREFCDRMRAAAGDLPTVPPAMVRIQVFMAVPPSWPKKKKTQMIGQMHRSDGDFDNFIKSIDGLFEQDKTIYWGDCAKFWCAPGEERTEVWALFHV